MTKVWKIEITAYNGSVTAFSEVSLYGSKELAEKTLQSIRAYNSMHKDKYLSVTYRGPEEINVYAKESDIPFFNKQSIHEQD